jgi:sugar O-acyltransferase (sialic acid O-acetyltransferase NeuD family)
MVKNRNLLILGAGGHAKSVADAAESSGWSFRGFLTSETRALEDNEIGNLKDLDSVDLSDTFVALGIGTNFTRNDAFEHTLSRFPNLKLVSIIHSTAWVSPTAELGLGSVVLAHASVGPHSIVGRGCIINTGATFDHDSRMGDFASLGPGSHTGGNVRIGDRSMIGLNSGIIQGRTVGRDTVIGAGSVVTEDIGDEVVALGSPCRTVRSRQVTDLYY